MSRQLPQVIQGAHPEPANLSCLDWMLGHHATVPPERGIFLPVSRRMHPEVCRFISDQVYEGRLNSHPDTARQAVRGTRFPEAGAFWVPVPHEGNAQIAAEEVEVIRASVTDLLKGTLTDKDGTTRPMRASDIIARHDSLRGRVDRGMSGLCYNFLGAGARKKQGETAAASGLRPAAADGPRPSFDSCGVLEAAAREEGLCRRR